MPLGKYKKTADVFHGGQTLTLFETLCLWVGRIVIFFIVWIALGFLFGGWSA